MAIDVTHENLDELLEACAEFIARSGRGPVDPRMQVAFAIARYLNLPDWPAAHRYRVVHIDDSTANR